MYTATDPDTMTIVEARTARGARVTLVTDPEGDYFVVEQRMFLGGDVLRLAHKIGPGDRLKDDVTRFSLLAAD